MSLSACLLTDADPARVSAALAPLAGIADTVVIGRLHTAAPGRAEAYERIADLVIAAEHHEEVRMACPGEWILTVHVDEVVSADLAARLPELMAAPGLGGYLLPRRWLSPDGGHWLDEAPWWPDFRLRLVRAGDAPGPVVRAAVALYHLKCATVPELDRHAEAIRLEVRERGPVAPPGAPELAILRPERHAALPLRPVPQEDRRVLAAALSAAGVPAPAWPRPRRPASVPAGETGEARIEPLERDLRFYAGVPRAVAFGVLNGSSEPWEPDGPHRLAYRWRWADGAEQEGPRTAFDVPVGVGGRCVVALQVTPPDREGPVSLAVDVVHEHVRWLGAEVRLAASVAGPRGLPTERPAREPPLRRRLGRRPPRIPPVLHRVWLGDRAIPEAHAAYGETWRRHHPHWEMRLWTDADAPSPPGVERARNLAERADLVRYEIIRRHGGVYVDTDVECLQPLDDLLSGVTAFAAYEVPGRLCNAVLGAVPGHAALERAVALAALTAGHGIFPEATATTFLTRVLEDYDDVTLFGPERFYPYLWDEPERRDGPFPGAYAVHHWAMSWVPPASTP